MPTALHLCQPDRANSMWPVSLDRAGIVPFASLLSHTGRRLRRLPPRLRRSWCRSIRKLPALTVAIRALDRRYAWLALDGHCAGGAGCNHSGRARRYSGRHLRQADGCGIGRACAPRPPEPGRCVRPRSLPQAGAALATPTSTPDSGSATCRERRSAHRHANSGTGAKRECALAVPPNGLEAHPRWLLRLVSLGGR